MILWRRRSEPGKQKGEVKELIGKSSLGFKAPKRGGGQIETETFSHRSRPNRSRTQARRQVQAAGPAWAWGPEDRSNIEAQIPNHAEIESTEPRPALISRGGVGMRSAVRAYWSCSSESSSLPFS